MSIEDDPTSMADFGFAGTFEYDEGTTMIDAPGVSREKVAASALVASIAINR